MREQSTVMLIKPDAFKRRLVGAILSRIESAGFEIQKMHFFYSVKDLTPRVMEHYLEHNGKHFYDDLVKFMVNGKVIAMVVYGEDVVAGIRTLIGATDPSKAAPGTIRGDFRDVGAPMRENLVHASDTEFSAMRECRIWGLFE